MAEGSISVEAPPTVIVETIKEEPLGRGSLNNLFNEGRFLMSRFSPDITQWESPHRLVRMAKAVGIEDPKVDLSINDDFQLGDDKIHMDWEATARVSDEPTEDRSYWNLRTLTMHDVPIEETGEAITVDFNANRRKGVLELGVGQGTKADADQVMRALWDYFKKVREYFNQNAVEPKSSD